MYTFAPSQPLIDDPDTHQPAHAEAVMRSHDMRELGLEVASDRLRMNVADLNLVYEARARADAELCPACPTPHRR